MQTYQREKKMNAESRQEGHKSGGYIMKLQRIFNQKTIKFCSRRE
jgi:hypothetical protein